jgi:transcriptional regulator with XRE-family HTH domain
MRHGLRQSDLAKLINYEKSYISALEIGLKGPPNSDFLERISSGLALTLEEKTALYCAVDASQRKLVIDADSPSELFLLLKDLRDTASQLAPVQIRLIREIARLPITTSPASSAVRRLKRKPKEEVTM